jgi:hypothetical protein
LRNDMILLTKTGPSFSLLGHRVVFLNC